jgi:succinate dehydrogenase flavin-adding protein (antitoxin of CptAB toxin-antitoxin module)
VTAAAKSESKMDAFAKEKVALETKNKGVAEADKTLRMYEMKRITDGMDAEAKNFEGLKEKTNYSQRLKLDLA